MRTLKASILVGMALALAACTSDDDDTLPDAGFPDSGRDGGGDATDMPDATVEECNEALKGSTIGMACEDGTTCSDGCFCNGIEQCVSGECAAGAEPCTDAIDCTSESCLEETDSCFFEANDDLCQDDDMCNGRERCDVQLGGCTPTGPPYCNDETSCTLDSCDSETGCTFQVRDLDGDGFTDGRCGGEDCDDDPRFGTMIYPGADEDCHNRRDDNCDGLRDYADSSCVPTNDTCESAEVLPGPGTYSGSSSGLAANYPLQCRASGPDAVFRFTLPELKDVRVAVSGGGSSGVAVAIRPWALCSAGPDDKCNTFSPPTLLRRSLPAGDYAIIVKTAAGAPFDLNLRFLDPTPVPPIDQCNDTTQVIDASGTFTGMFEETDDDYVLSCHGGGSGFRDAVYKLVLDAPKDVTLSATTTGPSWMPSTYLALTTDCAASTATLSCAQGTPGTFRRRALPAGTYFVLIESSAADSTSFELRVELTEPVPRNPGDACETAIDITSAMGTAMLNMAELDVGTSCGGTSGSSRDVFFTFNLTEVRDVELTTAAGFHYAALATTCGAMGSELRCRAGSAPLRQIWRSLPAGRYYVHLATTIAFGDATAQITTSAPTALPPNDRCDGAIDVSAGYNSVDTLIDFQDDVQGCAGSRRPDAFYKLTLTAPKIVSVIATRAPNEGTLYLSLRNACVSSTNLACDTSMSAPAVIDQRLEAGTYYLLVESPEASTTDYSLRVFLSNPR